MEDKKKKLYVGCTLSYLPEDKKDAFMQKITKIKEKLREHFDVIEFKGMDDMKTDNPLSPKDIYVFDIRECLEKSDFMLAICDYPGFGLGYEIGVAAEKLQIPTLALAEEGAWVSRLIRGVDFPHYRFEYYKSVDDIVKKSLDFFSK